MDDKDKDLEMLIKSTRWLKSAGVKAKTAELINATKDQGLPTKNYLGNIRKKK